MAESELSPDVHAHFHLFWDNFPFPVMLIRKDRTILDRNPAAAAAGQIPGTRCVDRGAKEAHQGCLANHALSEGIAKRKVEFSKAAQAVLDTYWIPLAGSDEFYLHFGINISDYAAERLFPAGRAAG